MAHEEESMVSMKRPKKTGDTAAKPVLYESPYGYGLCLRLENFELDALGIKSLPAAGQAFSIEARAVVESVHESQSRNNEGDRGVTLQITDLALSKGTKE